MHKLIVLVVLIIAAIGCYAIGGMMGVGIFIVLGMVFELVFWRKLFTKNTNIKN